jgi:SPP1 gp7 family putative phage head morphogenesis protein
MAEPVDLSYAFTLPPEQAIAYFQSKGYAMAFDWQAVWAQANAWSFTVAKAMQQDVLEAIRDELTLALKNGTTFAAFKKELEPRLRALGWWGRQEVVGPDGETVSVQLGSVRRLQTIFRNNIQTAYQVGRWQSFWEGRDVTPYLQYIAVKDGATRASHAALNLRAFKIDDRIWRYIYPPNGFNCRCRVRAYTRGQIERRGIAVSESGDDLQLVDRTDARTGLVYQQAVYKTRGMQTAFAPDKGWSYNPGTAWQTPFRDRVPAP